jgi:hypothetical protein
VQCSSWVSIVGACIDNHRSNPTQFTVFIIVCNYKYVAEYNCCCYIFGTYLLLIHSMLNLSDITSKFHSTATFVIINLQTIVHVFYGYVHDYLHTKFHMPHSNGSLVITVKWKLKKIFTLPLSLFYIFQKKVPQKKSWPYITSVACIKCHFQLTNLCIHHVVITNIRKL